MEGFKRIDIPELSAEALREAVINAVVHHDYNKRGETVRIFYYADQVEVHTSQDEYPAISFDSNALLILL